MPRVRARKRTIAGEKRSAQSCEPWCLRQSVGQEKNGPQPDTHFSGAKAIAAFNAAGGSSYTGARLPVENARIWAFNNAWRVSVFPGSEELMSP